MNSKIITGSVVAAGAAAVAILLSGCSSHSASAAPANTRASSASSAAGSTPAPAGTTGAASSPAAGRVTPTVHPVDDGTTQACTNADITVATDPKSRQAAMGHLGLTLDFTNTSERPCSMSGYPGVATVTASGQQMAQAVRTLNGYLGGLSGNPTSLPSFVLQPGQAAAAMIEGVSTDQAGSAQAGCDGNYQLLVTTPNTAVSHRLDANWPICTSLTVHPTQKIS